MSNKKPIEVKQVEAALKANGKEAGLRASLACYTRFDERNNEWIVGPNFEDGPDGMVFRDGKWFYRCPCTGEDRPMKNGFAEALANCRCAYTG